MEISISNLLGYVVLVFTGLFPIANPFSAAPVFLALTKNQDNASRNSIALKASLNMLGVLVAFLFAGALILGFFGITIPGLRIAGGLIIIVTGLRMLFPNEAQVFKESTTTNSQNIAFTPLAMPLLSGPGSISVVLTMADKVANLTDPVYMVIAYAVVLLGILLTVFGCWIVLRSSARVMNFLGESGIDVMTRIMAFFLIAIGVEFMLNGISAFVESLN